MFKPASIIELKVLYGFKSHLIPTFSQLSPVRCTFLKKITTYFEHLISKQDTEINSLIPDEFTLEVKFEWYCVTCTL